MANADKLLMFLREWEGLNLKCYDDCGQVACGYGHKMSKSEIAKWFGKTVPIEIAEDWLVSDAERAMNVVHECGRILLIPFESWELHALTSFIYNTGFSSDYIHPFILTLKRDLVRNDPFSKKNVQIYNQWVFMDKSLHHIHPLLFHFRLYISDNRHFPLKGLFDRRSAEANLFYNKTYERLPDYTKFNIY